MCGLNLETHAQLLAGEQAIGKTDEAPSENIEILNRRHGEMKRWGDIAFVGGGITAGVSLVTLMGLSNNLTQSPNAVVAWTLGGLLVAGLLGCFLGFVLSVLAAHSLPVVPPDLQSSSQPSLPQGQPTTRLPSELWPESLPSVTEHTTELMESVAPKVTVRNENTSARKGGTDRKRA
jgi:hypothetical protein